MGRSRIILVEGGLAVLLNITAGLLQRPIAVALAKIGWWLLIVTILYFIVSDQNVWPHIGPPILIRLGCCGLLMICGLALFTALLIWSGVSAGCDRLFAEIQNAPSASPSTTAPSVPVTALVMQCEVSYFPIAVFPSGEITILLLNDNPRSITQQNHEDHIFHWPPRELTTIPKDDAGLISKCAIASLNQALEEVSIPLDVVAGNSNKRITYTLKFPLLGSQPVVIYFVNQCPATASVVMPNMANAKLLDTEDPQDVPLRGAPPSSIGKIMFGTMFPSKAKWSDRPDCS